jgi:hypothetical protein
MLVLSAPFVTSSLVGEGLGEVGGVFDVVEGRRLAVGVDVLDGLGALGADGGGDAVAAAVGGEGVAHGGDDAGGHERALGCTPRQSHTGRSRNMASASFSSHRSAAASPSTSSTSARVTMNTSLSGT